MGSDICTTVSPKQILAIALKANACNINLSHNHPSGNLNPIKADIDITCKIREAAKVFDIQLLDHIIIGDGYYSMSDHGDI